MDKPLTDDARMDDSTLSHNDKARRLSRVTGLGYGLVYGLVFGISVWGHDARLLARSNAELAWAKLEIGLPLLLLICAVTGVLAGRNNRVGVWVGAWVASGALIGFVVGEIPFAGYTLATWIAEPALLGVNVYPIDPAGTARMAFTAAVTGSVGSVVGLVGHVLTERARTLASPTGRMMSGRRFAGALLMCLPLAALPGLIGDEIINKPLRTGQKTVHKAISVGSDKGSANSDVDPYRDQFSARYVLHLVDHDLGTDLETPTQETIDVTFDSGLVMRCQTSGYGLTGCLPISPAFESWMDGLIQEVLKGDPGADNADRSGREHPIEQAPQAGRLSVDDHTLRWLASQRKYMSDQYEISRDTQRGGWVILSAHFNTGYTLTCYFYGDSPVVLDHCSGHQGT
jgi:hypothetical protein